MGGGDLQSLKTLVFNSVQIFLSFLIIKMNFLKSLNSLNPNFYEETAINGQI